MSLLIKNKHQIIVASSWFYLYLPSVSPVVPRGQTNRQTDDQTRTWKLIAGFRNFSDAPKTFVVGCCMNISPHMSNIFWANSYERCLNAFWPAWRQSGSETIAWNAGITMNGEDLGGSCLILHLWDLWLPSCKRGLIDEMSRTFRTFRQRICMLQRLKWKWLSRNVFTLTIVVMVKGMV